MKMKGHQYVYSEKSNDASISHLQIGGEKVKTSLETKCHVCQEHHDILGLTDMFNLNLKKDVLVLMDMSHNNVRFPRDAFKIKYCPFCGRKL